MADKQLERVAQWEQEKEDKAAQDFRLAQQHADLQRQRLSQLEVYRLDYMRQSREKAQQGLNARNLNQQLAFVAKLDTACEQQMHAVSQAKMVAEQRKTQWLKQQQKRKAVELLLDKKRAQKAALEARQEQQLLDELATQRYVRR
ncbi:flagellar export protein FliJ [Aestuariibacter sp. AA17]|uniref:Flagellar FliJ protein n=1 Tax=Fluctibacter corallii TaxID=2984329 RepID=A0ABT3A9W2_9ALTE|nr:flagellar export protein FliJ [Aestuariibacter sp. AA17]MCV2885418.1 flagellar export protein FliJ [Aestuariibacter sp. AA17]